MNNEKPVSLYLILRPSDKDRMKPLARLIVSQMIRRLTEQMGFREAKDYKHRLLLMFDEFASLGRLEIFQESLAYMASYGIKAYLIVQDLTQLYHAYGKDEGIISNCHIRSAYAPNKVETAELLSKMSGTTTVIKRTLSTSGKRFGIGSGRVSAAIQEVQRPLLTVDECMRLPAPRKDLDGKITEAGDMLIFSAGQPPIYGKQILYFNDPVFSARASLPAPEMSDTITMRNPTKETIANVDFKLEKLSYEDVEYDSE
jgi:type IV secretion system protein VirD4